MSERTLSRQSARLRTHFLLCPRFYFKQAYNEPDPSLLPPPPPPVPTPRAPTCSLIWLIITIITTELLISSWQDKFVDFITCITCMIALCAWLLDSQYYFLSGHDGWRNCDDSTVYLESVTILDIPFYSSVFSLTFLNTCIPNTYIECQNFDGVEYRHSYKMYVLCVLYTTWVKATLFSWTTSVCLFTSWVSDVYEQQTLQWQSGSQPLKMRKQLRKIYISWNKINTWTCN